MAFSPQATAPISCQAVGHCRPAPGIRVALQKAEPAANSVATGLSLQSLRRTTELSDAGGPRRSHRQAVPPARIRCSDFVRRVFSPVCKSNRQKLYVTVGLVDPVVKGKS